MSEINNSENKLRNNLKKKRRQKRVKRLITWIVIIVLLFVGIYTYRYYNTHGVLPLIGREGAKKEMTGRGQEQTAVVILG